MCVCMFVSRTQRCTRQTPATTRGHSSRNITRNGFLHRQTGNRIASTFGPNDRNNWTRFFFALSSLGDLPHARLQHYSHAFFTLPRLACKFFRTPELLGRIICSATKGFPERGVLLRPSFYFRRNLHKAHAGAPCRVGGGCVFSLSSPHSFPG